MTLSIDGSISLPLLPLKEAIIFPQLVFPLTATRPTSIAAIEAAMQTEDNGLLVFMQKDSSEENPKAEDLYPIGARSVIRKVQRSEGRINLVVQGIERVTLVDLEQLDPYLRAKYEPLPYPVEDRIETEALRRVIMDLAVQIVETSGMKETLDLEQLSIHFGKPVQLAHILATILGLSAEQQQSILSAITVEQTLQTLHQAMIREFQVLQMRRKIADHARTEIDKQQRDFLLRQQLEAIQKELGEAAPEKAELDELRGRLESSDLPDSVKKEAGKEFGRLERMPSAAPDYQMTRTYLELLLDLPWKKRTTEVIDLVVAKSVLDEDHYNLEDIKDRILEFLAVLKLNPHAKGPILCLVGPPGVGKTSLGQSIARALGRRFERLSLGGLHDEAELRGHRRTYIGAMPGQILQAIRRAGVRNPLLMLDEVDKVGRDFRGDPTSALLEILDPAQNHAFRDNYLNLSFDLSDVLFITTANALDTIPIPLLDRMETLRLSGYTEEEKLQIARRYLIPRRLTEAGIREDQLRIPDETVRELISSYTHEAGVRELERSIGRLASKVARRFAEGHLEPVEIKSEELLEFLGPKKVRIERARKELPPGVAPGLAWTPTGGEILYIEASLLPGSEELRLTGQLGDVMRESAKAAQTYLWSHADLWGFDLSRFQKTGVHVHVPAGAIPKDGPSAGLAMISALASVFSGIPCRMDTAMTGEITLSGLILPVGGIKEKMLAANRAGIRRVILPLANGPDLREIPEEIRNQMEFKLFDRIEAALPEILPGIRNQVGGHPPIAAVS